MSVKDLANLFEERNPVRPEALISQSGKSWSKHRDVSPSLKDMPTSRPFPVKVAGRQDAEEQPPPLPIRRYQSTDEKLHTGNKRPPPVPSKSSALLRRFNTLQVSPPEAKHPELPRRRTTNIPVVDEDAPLITLIDRDFDGDSDDVPFEDKQTNTEYTSPPQDESDDVFQLVKKGMADFGSKISQTVNPLLANTKEGFDKVALAAKPVVAEAGRSLNQVGVGAKTVFDKTGVSTGFMKTQDDVTDAAAKLLANSGLCSKCQRLPVHAILSQESTETAEQDLEWATPLSRVIYHADWCRVCQLLLDMLCEPQNDPLKHPAVEPHVQPELEKITMRDWINQGWDYTDRYWPFGHGVKRHEGASNVLGPGSQVIGRLVVTASRIFTRTIINPRASTKYHRKKEIHKQQLENARNPTKHPLSCVVKITARTQASDTPGLLFVNLLGYGRKLGADLQVLSNFRLRAVTSNPTLLPPRGRAFSYGRLLDPEWIDPSIGRLWLRECESKHGSECSEHGWAVAMQKPKFLRVIDVEDLCIKEVTNPSQCRYIALSYVWGKVDMIKLQYKNMDSLTKKNGLVSVLDSIPQTIIDAIGVVKGMDERYLWVDALCILQERNSSEALEQINSMDKVYGSAIATIIAEGTTAHAGLGGIRLSHAFEAASSRKKQRQLKQIAAKVNDGTSIVVPLETDHNVDNSPWNARAWTFQERLLSQRLIIFTGSQMLFYCRKMSCREDMTVEDSGIPHSPIEWLSLKPRYMGIDADRHHVDGSVEITRHGTTRIVRSATFAEYVKAVEQYTPREMSFPSDILNAFAGLLHIFSLCFKGETSFGLPLVVLDTALLWRPTEQLKRRNGFPSWSWCGWIGQVAYSEPFRVVRGVDGKFISWATDPCGEEGIRPLIRWHIWNSLSRKVLLVNNTGLGFSFESTALPKEWENGPYCFDKYGNGSPIDAPPVPNHAPSSNPAMSNQCLVFWASSTTGFKLGKPIIQKSDRRWNATKAPLRCCLLDTDREVIGNLLLDGGDMTWKDQGNYEFIQVAEAQYLGLDNEPRDIEDCPLYLVMLIHWDQYTNVATRLGLGRVQKTAWMLAEPKLKLVRLA